MTGKSTGAGPWRARCCCWCRASGRRSFQTSGNGDAAYLAFIAFYVVCVAVTWTVYLRPGRRLQDV